MVTASREVVGRVTCVAASVQAAHICDRGLGPLSLDLQRAMSASSASTTIRSAFLLTLNPTVNCQDILASPRKVSRDVLLDLIIASPPAMSAYDPIADI